MSTNLSYREQTMIYSYKRVTITGVDTSGGILDAIDEGQQTYKVSLNYYNPSYTAIPAVGEIWLIKKMSNSWELYGRAEENNLNTSISNLDAGDHRIDVPNNLYLSTGGSIILSDGALANQIGSDSFKFPLDFNPGNDTGLNQDVLIVQGSENDQPLFSITEKVNEGYWALSWGDGTVAPDVSILRSKENTLKIDGDLEVTGSVVQFVDNPAAPQKYKITHANTQRHLDPQDTSLKHVADVLATLLTDLGYKA